jgi:hypothetical protein
MVDSHAAAHGASGTVLEAALDCYGPSGVMVLPDSGPLQASTPCNLVTHSTPDLPPLFLVDEIRSTRGLDVMPAAGPDARRGLHVWDLAPPISRAATRATRITNP